MGRAASMVVNIAELAMSGLSWQLILGGMVVLGIGAWLFGGEGNEE